MKVDDSVSNAIGLEEVAKAIRLNPKLPLAGQLYDALKQAIVTLRLMPGVMISESSICNSTGMSRTPVRSAIARLNEDGLIEVLPQRGSFVSLISLSSIRSSHFIRRSLEVALLKEVGKNWDQKKSAQAREILQVQLSALASGNEDGFYEADTRFHQMFGTFADLEGCTETIGVMRSKLIRFYRLFNKPERLEVVVKEHTAIVDALDAGNIKLAEKHLVNHIDKAFHLIHSLPETYGPFLTD
jgi:DNA-binding GntR family transcriptional regulator